MKAYQIFTAAALALGLLGSTQTMASDNTSPSSAAWERVLSKRVVNSFRKFVNVKIGVVPLGDGPETAEIARLLTDKINDAGGEPFAVLGCANVNASDADLYAISRCQRDKRDLTLVIRTFDGKPITAVLTLYSHDGESRVAKMLTKSGRVSDTEAKVPSRTAPTASKKSVVRVFEDKADASEGIDMNETFQEIDTDRVKAERSYNNRKLRIEAESEDDSGENETYWKGQSVNPLSPARFYNEVKRRGLADQYLSRSVIRKNTKLVTGIVGAGAGILALGAFFDPESVTNEKGEQMGLGTKLIVAGVSLASIGIYIYVDQAYDLHPTTAMERRDLVKSYNAKLRKELGLPPEASSLLPPEEPPVKLALAPILTTDRNLGLGLSLTW